MRMIDVCEGMLVKVWPRAWEHSASEWPKVGIVAGLRRMYSTDAYYLVLVEGELLERHPEDMDAFESEVVDAAG